MAQFYFDEYGQKRFVNETYGSVPPPGTPVYSDEAPQGLAPSPSPSTLPMSLSYEAPPALNGELFSGLPIQRMSPSLGNNPFSMEIPPSLPDYEQGGAASEAPAQRLGTGVDPKAPAVSPSLYGSNMFRTLEQEFEFNQAVARGDTKRAQELIREADVYAKERARSEKIDNMVNLAVMTGLGIAAGAPGSYGDFGTQVARGALTGINYGMALRQQDANADYKQAQLEDSRARALSYQQQVENSRRNTDLRTSRSTRIKVPTPDGVFWGRTNPYVNGGFEFERDSEGNPIPAPQDKPLVFGEEGVAVVDKSTNQATYVPDPRNPGQNLRTPPRIWTERSFDPATGQEVLGVLRTDGEKTWFEPVSQGPPNQGAPNQGPPVIAGSPTAQPVAPDFALYRVEQTRASMPGAPPAILSQLAQLEEEIRRQPGAFNSATLDRRLAALRQEYTKFANSSVGIAMGAMGTAPQAPPQGAPASSPSSAGPPLPPPQSMSPAALEPEPSLALRTRNAGTASVEPSSTQAAAPGAASGLTSEQQLIIDAYLAPLAAGEQAVNGTEAAKQIAEATGMSFEQAAQAVKDYMARNRVR